MAGENGEVSVEKVLSDFAEFYDQFSGAWEQDRGEHLHVGFYDVPSPPDNLLDDKAAAVRMVEEALKFADISAFKAMKGATPIHLWPDGFKQELVKYAVITAQKPA